MDEILKRLASDLIAKFERCEALGGWGNVRLAALDLANALRDAGGRGDDEATCRRCFAERDADAVNMRPAWEVAKRIVGKDEVFMPAAWFNELYGIQTARVRKAAARGALPTIGEGRRKRYCVAKARELWPQDFVGVPDSVTLRDGA